VLSDIPEFSGRAVLEAIITTSVTRRHAQLARAPMDLARAIKGRL
jgi:hypothetical protein